MKRKQPGARLLRLIEQLPENYREAMRLRYVEGRSYLAIANHLEKPIGTIKCWISRAKKRLPCLIRSEALRKGGHEIDLAHMPLADLQARIAMLPKSYRMFMEQHYIGGRSYAAIAQAAHCPVGTVKNRIHRAKKMLSEYECW